MNHSLSAPQIGEVYRTVKLPCLGLFLFVGCTIQRGKQVESDRKVTRREKRREFDLLRSGGPGGARVHRAGPGERGGGSYGRRAVAAAKGASMQISGGGRG